MTIRRRAITLLLTLVLFGGAVSVRLRADGPPPASVTLVHFNDVYEIDAVEDGRYGGLARVKTMVDRIRRKSGPVLVTLGGDFVSPSAIGTARVDGQALAGRQMIDVLNEAGLQLATLGNHEFDVNEAQFHARMAEAKFTVVVSNVTDAAGVLFDHTVSHAIVPVKSGGRTLRIGFIGLVIDSNGKPWVKYSDPIEAARRKVAELRGKVDAIVALTHLSLAGDQEVATSVPEIDVILGGHEHENWMIRRGPALTPIIKADANVRTLAVVTLDFGRGTPRPVVNSTLEILDSRVSKNARVDAVVKRWVTTAFDAFRKDGFQPERVVATVLDSLDGRETTVRNRSSLMTDILVASAVREGKNADGVIYNAGSIRIDDVVAAGPLSEYDVIRILPFGGKLLKVTMDGALLTQTLDAGVANKGTGGYLQLGNIAKVDSGWALGGKLVAPGVNYTIVMPEYLLTGGEAKMGFLTRTNPGVRNVEELRDARFAFIDELQARYKK